MNIFFNSGMCASELAGCLVMNVNDALTQHTFSTETEKINKYKLHLLKKCSTFRMFCNRERQKRGKSNETKKEIRTKHE